MALNLGTAIGYLTLDISGFEEGFREASNAMNGFNAKGATTASKFQSVGNTLTSVGSTLTNNVTMPIVGVGTSVIKTGMEFEHAMSQVKKTVVTAADFEEKEFEKLTKYARDMGKETTFTATQAANALEYMGMAGWDLKDMFGNLKPILNLAIAGNTDLATTSDIVTDSLTGFGLTADKTGRFCDILAAASMNSNTNVNLLGESFKYVAPVAGAFRFTAEDTALALGVMANAGIKSSMAGTSLRSVMSNLANPVGQSALAVEALGLNITKADGSTRSWRDIMDELRSKLGGATMPADELADRLAYLDEQFQAGAISEEEYANRTMALAESAYTSSDAQKVQLAAMLAGKTGMSGLLSIVNASQEDYNKLAEAIDNSSKAYNGQGTTAEMAATAQRNLQSDIDILISKLSDLAISIFELVKEPLSDFIDKIGNVVDWMNSLDDGVKEGIVQFVLFIAAIGPVLSLLGNLIKIISGVSGAIKVVGKVGGPIAKFIPKLIGFIPTILSGLGTVIGVLAEGVTGAISAVVAAIGWIPIAIAAVIGVFVLLYNKWDAFHDLVNKVASAVKDFFLNLPENIGKFFDWLVEHLEKIFDFVGEWGSKLWDKAGEIGKGFVDAIVKFIGTLPELLKAILNKIIDTVSSWIKGMIKVAQGIFEFVTNIVAIVAQLPGKILQILSGILKDVVNWGADFVKKGVEAASQFLKKVIDVVTSLPKKLMDLLQEAVNAVVDWGANLLHTGVDVATNFLHGIVDIIRMLPGGIGEHLANVLDAIINWGASIAHEAINIGSDFLKNIVGFFTDTVKGVIDILANCLKGVIDFGKSVVDAGVEIARNFVSGFLDGVSKVGEGLSKLGKTIIDAVKNIGRNLFNAGSGLVDSIAEGIKSAVNKVSSALQWVVNKALSLVGITNAVNSTNNPRAVGVDYVPYNGYGATLHEGEMVLTKEEAERYRKGIGGNGYGGSSDIFIFNSPKAIDEREAARLLKQTKRELKLGF